MNLGSRECELALSSAIADSGGIASVRDVVVVLLGGQFGSSVPRTGQRRLVGCIHDGDQNKFVIVTKQIEASGECSQCLIRSIGAQQDWRMPWALR